MIVCLSLALAGVTRTAVPTFSPDERAAIVAYWAAPERHAVAAPPEASKTGPWVVRLTPGASRWFWAYQRAVVGPGKPPPNADVKAAPDWEKWVTAKLDYDRAAAQRAANAANAAVAPGLTPPAVAGSSPPGPIPADLLAAAGNPPAFAEAVVPMRHIVTFDDLDTYTYVDHTAMRPRYAYYRFDGGVMSVGKPLREMTDAELDPLFAQAGMTPSEARAAKAVSRLEGGFDAVNTYDTGYVSIGFIQCITGQNGTGSLMDVLSCEKTDRPDDYQKDFRRFGIDVSAQNVLTVVDPSTGAELTGPDAVLKVIDDKRLTAVFQRAGRRSEAFRAAQVKVAKSRYWPADDRAKVRLGGADVEVRVGDVVRSEAGLATLFDRKVNRGSVSPFAEVLARVIADRNCTTLDDVRRYERDIIVALKYRTDFLQDATLSKPR